MRNHRARWAAIGAAVAVSIGAGGLITLANAAGGTASTFTPITPCRLLDTRPSAATGSTPPRTSPLGARDTYTVPARGDFGNCVGLSSTASGAALNVTVVNPTAGSFLTVWPADQEQPLASVLNWGPGQGATPNHVTTALDSAGQFSIYNNAGNVDVIVDVVGLYEPSSGSGTPGAPGAPGAPGSNGAPGAPGAPGKAATNVMTAAAPVVGSSGQFNAMVLDSAGNPVISHIAANGDLLLTHCDDPACAPPGDDTNIVDNVTSPESNTSLALDSNGNPVISYYDADLNHLMLVHCNDTKCAGGNENPITVDATNFTGTDSSLALDASGFPVISYNDAAAGLKVVHCNDANCGTKSQTNPDSTDGSTGLSTSLVLSFDGRPVISYYDASTSNVRLLVCGDGNCGGPGDVIRTLANTPLTVGNDQNTDLALDSNWFPVVTFLNVGKDPAVAHCNDAFCGTFSSNPLQTANSTTIFASVALAAGDIPVVSYVNDSGRLTVGRCNNTACTTSVNTIADNATDLAAYTSIVLDSLGNPIISSDDTSGINDSLIVTRCVDVYCNPNRIRTVNP